MAPVAPSKRTAMPANRNNSAVPGESPIRLIGWIAAYTLLSWFTRAYFMADTVDYASSVYLHDHGVNYLFWDFRHLFWKPFGWVLLHLLGPMMTSFTGGDPRVATLYIFIALDW